MTNTFQSNTLYDPNLIILSGNTSPYCYLINDGFFNDYFWIEKQNEKQNSFFKKIKKFLRSP